MKRIAFAIIALSLAACSGNFSSGTGMPSQAIPPMPSNPPPYGTNGMPQAAMPPSALPSGSPAPAASPAIVAIADAPSGLQCPSTTDGYACLLRFNIPPGTPAPSSSPDPTSTPSPSPSPSPSASASASPAGSASPAATATSSGGTVTLTASALPKDAPSMYHTPPNTLDVFPLIMVHLTPNADFTLNGAAEAQFTLPKEQIAGRGFAVQLFKAKTDKKQVTTYTPIWTFNKPKLKDDTLTFDFTPPKTTIPKGSTYVLVLYGDVKRKGSPSPSPAPSSTPSAAPNR